MPVLPEAEPPGIMKRDRSLCVRPEGGGVMDAFSEANERFGQLVQESLGRGELPFRLATELLQLQVAQMEAYLQLRALLTERN